MKPSKQIPLIERVMDCMVTGVELHASESAGILAGPESKTMLYVTNKENIPSIEVRGMLPLEKYDVIRAYWREPYTNYHDKKDLKLEDRAELMFEDEAHARREVHKIEKLRNGEIIWTYFNGSTV
ncbi:MAG TPA: hypothetical protein VLJ21_01880 [Candidatus Binatia bacterium]|nr:hypothetical protein [Candidatus Binatia bacterium]